ncbi:MAG TPA: 2,3-oxidosqualene cyclase [Myxococcaceae bacterium]|nr:2,3-oxidosqualene cyclase [Myxococcaceae bacterium]
MRVLADSPGDPTIDRGLRVLAETQAPWGAWKGDYGGPLFLPPLYICTLHALGRPADEATRAGFLRFLRGHQNPDGGWGLDVEGPSQVFSSVLNYVALRLLGLPRDDEGLGRARAWFLPRGGALGSASWGKFMLAVLGLYEYEGLHPVQPELWLLPRWLPVHPGRLWCHCRMVYLPMSHLYGRRARVPESPLLAQLREEIYAEPYAGIDWRAARDRVAPTDAYTPRSALLRHTYRLLDAFERFHPRSWRERALAEVRSQIQAEDAATHHICIGPVNKLYNTLVWHFERPGGEEERAHLPRLTDYLWEARDGLKMNGYNSSELWDTAFAVQAIAATGEAEALRPTLARAHRFIEGQQVLEDTPEPERFYRHPSQGGWPFSTREHGWPISDCTAEGLKAALLLERLAPGDTVIPPARLADAVDILLSLQNADGGWATYELRRGPTWLELLNPSDVFGDIMVDYPYVECTSASVQALAAYLAAHPGGGRRRERAAQRAIARGRQFLLGAQREDGSWEGSWGVCFSYGTWFGTWGLRAAGVEVEHPALRRATAYLRAHQMSDGGWGETIESCRQRTWVNAESGQAVMTSWALMALHAAGEGASPAARRGVAFLRARQLPDGRWPPEHIAGVFNKTCAIHYDAYLRIFPVWALALTGGLPAGRQVG